jgi:hypothetical protein
MKSRDTLGTAQADSFTERCAQLGSCLSCVENALLGAWARDAHLPVVNNSMAYTMPGGILLSMGVIFAGVGVPIRRTAARARRLALIGERADAGGGGDAKEGIKRISTPRGFDALEVESIRALKVENDALRARIENLETGAHPIAAGFTSGLGFSPGNAGISLLTVVAAFMVTRRKRAERA